MATAVLKHVKKIYPLQDDQKKKRKKGEELAKKNNLQITEDGVVAVQDFNLEIADKEFIVLVGPSGCGKSTTLRMIAGLEDITDGDFYIDGKRVNDIAARDRDISMVFQNYALYPHMSVYDNIAFPLKMRHVPKDEIDRKVKEAAEILNITEYLDRKPRNMSGGQRQRVAIGRAIVREPKLLLMDEPLSNLDAKLRNQMRAEIIKLRKKINTTFVYVTHDQTEAMTLGDRIVIMCDGFIQQIGTPQEVFDHPSNLFVAEFIGTPKMNIFTGKLTKKDGFQLTCQKADITISDRIQKQLENGNHYSGEVLIGCRPEHIYLTEKGPNAIKATVDVCEMMGSELHLHVSVENRDVIVRVQTVDLDEKHKIGFQFGEEVYLAFQPDLIHLFHPETKENLI